jgi:hypothetical protein
MARGLFSRLFGAESDAAASVQSKIASAVTAYNRRDYRTSVKLLGELAAEGNAAAAGLLGEAYFHGNGVPQNYDSALRLIMTASEGLVSRALFQLGTIHEHGITVDSNAAKAFAFYSLAADVCQYVERKSNTNIDDAKSRLRVLLQVTDPTIIQWVDSNLALSFVGYFRILIAMKRDLYYSRPDDFSIFDEIDCVIDGASQAVESETGNKEAAISTMKSIFLQSTIDLSLKISDRFVREVATVKLIVFCSVVEDAVQARRLLSTIQNQWIIELAKYSVPELVAPQ